VVGVLRPHRHRKLEGLRHRPRSGRACGIARHRGEHGARPERGDGTIWQEWFSGGWNGPQQLFGPGSCGGGNPANPGQTLGGVSTGPGEISVYWTGQDGTGQTTIQEGHWDPRQTNPRCSNGWSYAKTIAAPTVAGDTPTATQNTLLSAVNNQSDREATVVWEGPAAEVLQVWSPNATSGTWSSVLGVVGRGPFGPVP
jgi:hypothetical protein